MSRSIDNNFIDSDSKKSQFNNRYNDKQQSFKLYYNQTKPQNNFLGLTNNGIMNKSIQNSSVDQYDEQKKSYTLDQKGKTKNIYQNVTNKNQKQVKIKYKIEFVKIKIQIIQAIENSQCLVIFIPILSVLFNNIKMFINKLQILISPKSVDQVAKIYSYQQKSSLNKKQNVTNTTFNNSFINNSNTNNNNNNNNDNNSKIYPQKIQNFLLNQGIERNQELNNENKQNYQQSGINDSLSTSKNSYNQIVFNYKPNIVHSLDSELVKHRTQIKQQFKNYSVNTSIDNNDYIFAQQKSITNLSQIIGEQSISQDNSMFCKKVDYVTELNKIKEKMRHYIQQTQKKEKKYLQILKRQTKEIDYLRRQIEIKDNQK